MSTNNTSNALSSLIEKVTTVAAEGGAKTTSKKRVVPAYYYVLMPGFQVEQKVNIPDSNASDWEPYKRTLVDALKAADRVTIYQEKTRVGKRYDKSVGGMVENERTRPEIAVETGSMTFYIAPAAFETKKNTDGTVRRESHFGEALEMVQAAVEAAGKAGRKIAVEIVEKA